MLWFLVVILCGVTPAFAAGGSWPVFTQAATNYSGGCTGVGTFNGTTVPRCDNSADGAFYVETEIPDFCSSATTLTAVIENKQNGGTGATGNVCTGASVLVITEGADTDQADWSFSSMVYVSDALSACVANAGSNLCVSDATGTITPKDANTGSACASTTCNKRTAVVKGGRDTGVSCASDSTTSIDIVKIRLTCS